MADIKESGLPPLRATMVNGMAWFHCVKVKNIIFSYLILLVGDKD